MIRKIIHIKEEKCNGCGACATACHEGAIAVIDGKAKLMREDYCDGLGDCLPVCPVDAISFEEREAPAYDEEAVKRAKKAVVGTVTADSYMESKLSQWPVQIKLVPVNAPYFSGADLLIAADCTAYAYGDFHRKFMQNRITLIGCPKLDEGDYADKLTQILCSNEINSITVARMEVPCCGRLEFAVKRALEQSGKQIPCQVTVISANGTIMK